MNTNGPQTAEGIAAEFKAGVDDFLARDPSDAKWRALQERMISWFATIDPATRFEAGFLVMKSCVYQHQLLMGEVLERTGTPLKVNAHEFIRQLAPTMNASADTIVDYLVSRVGQDRVRVVCGELLRERFDKNTRDGIRTFQYHAGVHQ